MSGENGGSSSGGRCYVDNSYNRRLGRVGMPLGSMVVSSGGRPSSGSSSFLSSSLLGIPSENSGSGRSYVDNSYNRALGRVGMPLGSMVVSNSDYRPSPPSSNILSFSANTGENSGSGRSYVDNSYNRALGRVGMPLGSMVVSNRDYRPSSPSSNILRVFGNSDENIFSGRSYVDNSYNRTLGRVGMPLGSMAVSNRDNRPSLLISNIVGFLQGVYGGDSESWRSYVDNIYYSTSGRDGMPVGSTVVSSGESRQSPASSSFPDLSFSAIAGKNRDNGSSYVDNSYNRALGRVSMPLGSMVVSDGRRKSSPERSSFSDSSFSAITGENSASGRSYVDNSHNKTQNGIGMQLGSTVVSSEDSMPSSAISSCSSSSFSGKTEIAGGRMSTTLTTGHWAELVCHWVQRLYLVRKVGRPQQIQAFQENLMEIVVQVEDHM